jgi:Na+-translocating ferredoxin:NAD+ oxidoreductase subunit D
MEPIKEPKPLVLVSSSPHMHCGLTISKSMREVILALVPAVLASVYYFRVDAVRVIVCCVLSAIIFEKLANKVMGVKKDTVKDGSAALTGLLLALCLPASLPATWPSWAACSPWSSAKPFSAAWARTSSTRLISAVPSCWLLSPSR